MGEGPRATPVPAGPRRTVFPSTIVCYFRRAIWIQRSPQGTRPIEFLIVQLDGRIVGRLQVELDVVYEIGRDYVLGSYTAEDLEPHVVAYRFRRR